ncbi:thiol:disulfide interchange protein DsbA/DsbL [Photobacterium japonica]|uniref:thiol:disulfide interchange protein DsbA/DsbL n=1 Tax=Photobacterium japonica TaxID=2910235 RepID=UPI003D0B2B01
MNKRIKFLAPAAFLLAILAGCSDNNVPKEGTQYTVVPTPTENVDSVVEVFSLGCGHCRNMETMLPEIKKMADVDVQQMHVTFNKSAELAAYIYYTAAIQTNGKPSPELKEALFGFVQDKKADATEEENQAALNAIFAKYGLVSPYALDDAQREKVFKMLTDSRLLETNAQITSVPSFLVQGKYLVNNAEHESLEDLANTIQYLSQKQD